MIKLLPIIFLFFMSCEKGWLNKIVYPPGCTDESACNYEPDASKDDDSCEYPIENFDCEGECLIGMVDCFGVCNGLAVEDNCGVCDFDTTNDCIEDCAGVWGGNNLLDECGVLNVGGEERDIFEFSRKFFNNKIKSIPLHKVKNFPKNSGIDIRKLKNVFRKKIKIKNFQF